MGVHILYDTSGAVSRLDIWPKGFKKWLPTHTWPHVISNRLVRKDTSCPGPGCWASLSGGGPPYFRCPVVTSNV